MNSVEGMLEQSRAKMEQAISLELSAGGEMEERTAFSARINHPYPVRHWLHLLLTVVTLGFWSWVWLVVWIRALVRRRVVLITLDPATGNVDRIETKK